MLSCALLLHASMAPPCAPAFHCAPHNPHPTPPSCPCAPLALLPLGPAAKLRPSASCVPLADGSGCVVRRVIAADNSCLFNAVGHAMHHSLNRAPHLRNVVAREVAGDPQVGDRGQEGTPSLGGGGAAGGSR